MDQREQLAKAELLCLRAQIKNNEVENHTINTLKVFETIGDILDIEVTKEGYLGKRKKAWNKRPDCWMDIVKHFEDYGLQNTLSAYKEKMQHIFSAVS